MRSDSIEARACPFQARSDAQGHAAEAVRTGGNPAGCSRLSSPAALDPSTASTWDFACATSGLNAAILRAASGELDAHSTSRALHAGKLKVCVPALHIHAGLCRCDHLHRDKRTSRFAFE